MAKIVQREDRIIEAIYKYHEARAKEQEPRFHLGASIIGRKCEMQILFMFRHALGFSSKFNGRVLRLFLRGQREEEIIADELRGIGCHFIEADETGKQFSFHLFCGLFGGSCDGIILSGLPGYERTRHIVEMKTHNEKSFAKLTSDGVLLSKPEHYAQMQVYMGLSGVKWGDKNRIERALYIAANKNTDSLHIERVRFDENCFNETVNKAEKIIFMTGDIDRVSDTPSWYECKFCDYKDVCHNRKFPKAHCLTCAFMSPNVYGDFYCDLKGERIPKDEKIIEAACERHLFDPRLVKGGYVVECGTPEAITFRDRLTDKPIVNGKGGYASKQLELKTSDEIVG